MKAEEWLLGPSPARCMSKVNQGNQEITGSGEITIEIGQRHRRPDLWEVFFVDGLSDHNHHSCGHHPKDHVVINVHMHPVHGHFLCTISWVVYKTRRIFWQVAHYD